MTRLSSITLTIAASSIALSACMKSEPVAENVAAVEVGAEANNATDATIATGNAATAAPATFFFKSGDGKDLGTVSVSEDGAGLTLALNATGMPAGVHGIHLHEKGLCDGPKFETAGAHWNPASKKHGRDNPAGAHAGDLANITVNPDGSAKVNIPIAGVMMAKGAQMLADADGTALVIHAKADDYKTDPSGESGDRIACAVVAKGG